VLNRLYLITTRLPEAGWPPTSSPTDESPLFLSNWIQLAACRRPSPWEDQAGGNQQRSSSTRAPTSALANQLDQAARNPPPNSTNGRSDNTKEREGKSWHDCGARTPASLSTLRTAAWQENKPNPRNAGEWAIDEAVGRHGGRAKDSGRGLTGEPSGAELVGIQLMSATLRHGAQRRKQDEGGTTPSFYASPAS